MVDEGLSIDSSSDLPLDFLTYLEHRLGVSRDTAIAALGEWLARYEPIQECSFDVPKAPASNLNDDALVPLEAAIG